MKVLVTGGRDFTDWIGVYRVLDKIHNETPITMLVHGDARGADRLAKTWATLRGVPQDAMPAVWRPQGPEGPVDRAAGPVRNSTMLIKHPDIRLVVAFEGGVGTADMVRKAKNKGIQVQNYP